MKITYLFNSGFMVELGDRLLVFDYYKDPQDLVGQKLAGGSFREVYFFASHSHYDHFNPAIARFNDVVAKYFLSLDIRYAADVTDFPREKVVWLDVYDHYEDENIHIDSFSSTDMGTSFMVTVGGKKIFHAGDFNSWDWPGDFMENQLLARNGFNKQLKRLEGLTADVAFFPVDGRLESSMEHGAYGFIRTVDTHALVAMHSVGYPAWQPSEGFFPGEPFPTFAPVTSGESFEIK